MSTSPPIVPTRVPSRSIMLASFAGGGILLAGLLLVLVGCSAFTSAEGEVKGLLEDS